MKSIFTISFVVLLAAGQVHAFPVEARQNRNNNRRDLQSSLVLDSSLVGLNIAQDGLANGVTSPSPPPFLRDTDNPASESINFCASINQRITNGEQIPTGSCNPVPIGQMIPKNRIPSSGIRFPKNFDTIPANQDFTIQVVVRSIETGVFVNPKTNYYGAPQQLNDDGVVYGHGHVVVEAISALDATEPLDPLKFTYQQVLNKKAIDGVLSADVPGGVPAGTYRLCTQLTAANHQPFAVSVNEHGSLDVCTYFTTTDGGDTNGN
ncbi:hypothetical protein FRB99_006684 [Tulasnella sp. 403]|nr:hypothetical protein FRB99_006684 [Tulasnella sp. 403]